MDGRWDKEPSEKARRFVEALEVLCRAHDVQLTTSSYDSLQVWDLRDGEPPVYCAGFDDMTEAAQK
jgi:hypothetical protein